MVSISEFRQPGESVSTFMSKLSEHCHFKTNLAYVLRDHLDNCRTRIRAMEIAYTLDEIEKTERSEEEYRVLILLLLCLKEYHS